MGGGERMWNECLSIATAIHEANRPWREAQRRLAAAARARLAAKADAEREAAQQRQHERDHAPRELPESCYCSVLGHMAPCGWCTDPARSEEDFR